MKKREKWNSQLGFLLAAIGAAIGLGNIWRFSYLVYENGGGAFLVPYGIALLTTGIPLMILEYGFGHNKHGSSVLAFAKVGRKYEWFGWWMPVFVMFGIMLYYSVIIGWCINFSIYSIGLQWGKNTEHFFVHEFLKRSSGVDVLGSVRPGILLSTLSVWALSWFVCSKKINHGIEKACKIFMPLLLILIAVLVFWGITLDGAREGILWYLKPDWSKLANTKVWIEAFGQIFFTLSICFGIMITYASYLPDDADIVKNAYITSFANCGFSLFSGFAVFSVLGYMAKAKGVPIEEVIKSGPTLAFVVYPEAINNLPMLNSLFGFIFFFALVIAGFSSAISLIEGMTAAIIDKFDVERKIVVPVLCISGFLGSILFCMEGGLYWLDIVDHFINQYGLMLAGLIEAIIIGWIVKASVLRNQVNSVKGVHLSGVWDKLVKFFIPAVLVFILYYAVASEVAAPYGNYPRASLNWIGLGWVLGTLVLSVILSIIPWHPQSKIRLEHHPEDESLIT